MNCEEEIPLRRRSGLPDAESFFQMSSNCRAAAGLLEPGEAARRDPVVLFVDAVLLSCDLSSMLNFVTGVLNSFCLVVVVIKTCSSVVGSI